MANTLANPTGGFREFGRREGGSPTYGMTQVWIASTDASNIFRGDPVITSSTPGTNAYGNYITQAASGASQVRGIFQGLEQYQPSVGRMVWANNYAGTVTGSTGDIRAWIIDDPQRLWLVQGSTTQAIGSSLVGLNFGFVISSATGPAGGNTTTGLSNVVLQSTTFGSTSTLPFRVIDFYSNYAPPGNPAIGTAAVINGTDNTSPANIVVVAANNWDRASLTARST